MVYYPGLGKGVNADQVAGNASNIRAGDNPPFIMGDFLLLCPQFGPAEDPKVPDEIFEIYLDLADTCIKESRFRKAWKLAMGYFLAHFCTLWLQTAGDAETATKESVVAAGQATGITVSESVDGVSYTMDVASVMQDLNGFGAFKSTSYGVQLATLAKMYGKGGMVIR